MVLSWVNLFNKKPARRLIQKMVRPSLELLEDRLVPATHTWTGAASNLWSNGNNWTGGKPVAGEAHTALVFPAGASNVLNVNDVAGLTLESISFTGGGYFIGANGAPAQVTLTKGITVDAAVTTTITLGLNFKIAATQSFFVGNSAASLLIAGTVSGVGTSGLTKTGAGTLTLSGVASNTYAGATIVNDGTLSLNKTPGIMAIPGSLVIGDAVGAGLDLVVLQGDNQINDAAAVTIAKTGELKLNGFNEKIGPLTVTGGQNSTLLTGAGTLTLNGNVTVKPSDVYADLNGKIDLGGVTRTFTVGDGVADPDLRINAVLSNGGVVKAGAGQMILAAANTYAGLTSVNGGELDIFNSQALGSTAAGTVVADGAMLEVAGGLAAAEPLQLSGKGVNGRGALTSAFGANTWSGPITLTATVANPNVLIGSTSKAETMFLQGTMSGTGGLTTVGVGDLSITGATPNTYAGTTVAQNANLVLAKPGGGAVPHVFTVNFTNVRLDNSNQLADKAAVQLFYGALDLNDRVDTIGALILRGGAVKTATGMLTLGGDVTANDVGNSIDGNLNLGGTRTITVPMDADLVINAIISNGALTKAGAGTLELAGANTYAGLTKVNAGYLVAENATALGAAAAGTVVADGGALRMQNININGEALQLSGMGPRKDGAFANFQNVDTYTGVITLVATPANPSVWIGAFSDLTINGVISGNAGLTGFGLDHLILAGNSSNTYTGLTRVTGNILTLNKSAGLAVPHGLLVDLGSEALLAASNQIPDDANVTIGGKFVATNQLETVGTLTFNGGFLDMGTGTLTVKGNINANIGFATAQGHLDLGGAARNFTVAAGASLDVKSTISNGAITKSGAGELALEGANTYAGATTINAGILRIDSNSALGTTAVGTVVADGATLRVEHCTVLSEALQLAGKGAGGEGALDATSGNALWTGPVNLNATLANPNVYLGARTGADNLFLGGTIQGNAGATKVGSGNMQILGGSANTYAGLTHVSNGGVTLGKATGQNAIPHDLVIDKNGTVIFSAADQVPDHASVTIGSAALFNTSTFSDKIGKLIMAGGSAGGTLTITDNITANASPVPSVIFGALDLGGVTRTTNVVAGGILSITANVSNGGLTKVGSGDLVLGNANSYAGLTTINAGRLIVIDSSALGTTATGTVVADGAILALNGGVNIGNESLTLSGAARLKCLNGFASWAGDIVLNATAANPNIVVQVDAGILTLSGALHGTAGLTKNGFGALELVGATANTYAGTTRVTTGKLMLGKTAGVTAVPHNLIIGDGLGPNHGDIVQWLADEQIADGAMVTLNGTGLIDLGGFTETIHSLIYNGGAFVNVGNLLLK
jgi:fibronectin-binding autotransporter adhesin